MKNLNLLILSFLMVGSALCFAGQQQDFGSDVPPAVVTAPDEKEPQGQFLPDCEMNVSCSVYPNGRYYLKTQVCTMPISVQVVEGTPWDLGCPQDVLRAGNVAKLETFSKTHCAYKFVDKNVSGVFRCYYTHTDGKDIR